MIDHAKHLMAAHRLIKNIYEHCESHRPMEAMEDCLMAITELKMAYTAINHYIQTNDPDQISGIWNHEGL